MKFEALAETCELEIKNRMGEVDDNLNIINEVANRVEAVINSKLEDFNKSVNTADKEQINNSGDNAADNDNTGDSAGNNDSANGSAESE